jgi:hypothetical protein
MQLNEASGPIGHDGFNGRSDHIETTDHHDR